jgi:hypothetical protein
LKEFFRSLWQLTSVIQRHDSSDVDWTLLLLLELLRAEAPLQTADLLRSKPFRESLAASTFFAKTSDDKQKQSSREKLLQQFESIVDGQLTPQRKDRVLPLIDRFGEVSLTTEDRIAYWANIREQPPAMTSKEAKAIFHGLGVQETGANVQQRLAEHAKATATDIDNATSGLFRKLIELREAELGAASESDVLQELREHVNSADAILNVISMMVIQLKVFAKEPREAAVVDFMRMYEHFAHWAHFNNTPEYVAARQRERELLLQGAASAGAIAAAILRHLKFSDPFAQTALQAAAQVLREQVIAALLPFVITDVRNRFERTEGIASLRNPDADIQRHLLMSPTSGLYSDDFIQHLQRLSVDAKSNMTVQKNFIELIRGMANSYTEGGAASDEAQARLKRAAEFLPHVWAGAVASPIQPRLLGSLRQDLDRLNGTFKPFGVELAVPAWWRESDVELRASSEQ